MKTIEQIINKIYKDNDIYYEWSCNGEKEVDIVVDFGDWKHDNGFIDYLMRENGFVKIGEDITYEDGSDCYSSIHYYDLVASK